MQAGITGHQNLGDKATVAWVAAALSHAIQEHGITAGVTSLAVGADQLFATCLLAVGLPFHVIVPSHGYEKTFRTAKAKANYRRLLRCAQSVEVLPNTSPTEHAFLKAGFMVIERSELLLAVWDGLPAKGEGGTADIVAAALRQNLKVVQINPRIRAVGRIGEESDEA